MRLPCRFAILVTFLLRARCQTVPNVTDVTCYDDLVAAVQAGVPFIRVVSHISFAAANNSVAINGTTTTVFGDAAQCALSAATLAASDFGGSSPHTFARCTLHGASVWRHFSIYAGSGPITVNFADLR